MKATASQHRAQCRKQSPLPEICQNAVRSTQQALAGRMLHPAHSDKPTVLCSTRPGQRQATGSPSACSASRSWSRPKLGVWVAVGVAEAVVKGCKDQEVPVSCSQDLAKGCCQGLVGWVRARMGQVGLASRAKDWVTMCWPYSARSQHTACRHWHAANEACAASCRLVGATGWCSTNKLQLQRAKQPAGAFTLQRQ